MNIIIIISIIITMKMMTARTQNGLILSELESAKFISAEEELDGWLSWVEGGDTKWTPGGPLIGQVGDLHRRPISI